jgi:DNA-binding GntR family transcriptional regulator
MADDSVAEPLARLSLPSRPESLMDLVYATILEAIKTKALPPGSRVTEAGLAEQFNVSKTPVREALLRLKEIGLIEDEGKRGGRIAVASVENIIATFEAREALEVYLAARAAVVADDDDLERIRTAAQGSSDAACEGAIERYQSFDVAFHDSICNTVGNPILTPTLQNILTRVAVFRARELSSGSFSMNCGAEHVAIADAIESRDSDMAAELMRSHVQHVSAYLVERFLATAAGQTDENAPAPLPAATG